MNIMCRRETLSRRCHYVGGIIDAQCFATAIIICFPSCLYRLWTVISAIYWSWISTVIKRINRILKKNSKSRDSLSYFQPSFPHFRFRMHYRSRFRRIPHNPCDGILSSLLDFHSNTITDLIADRIINDETSNCNSATGFAWAKNVYNYNWKYNGDINEQSIYVKWIIHL